MGRKAKLGRLLVLAFISVFLSGCDLLLASSPFDTSGDSSSYEESSNLPSSSSSPSSESSSSESPSFSLRLEGAEYAVVGEEYELSLDYQGADEFDEDSVAFSLSNESMGTITGNVFLPSLSGTARISATYLGVSSNELQVEVYDFGMSLPSYTVEVGESLVIDFTSSDYSFLSAAEPVFSEEGVIDAYLTSFGQYRVRGLSAGQASFYLSSGDKRTNELSVTVAGDPYENVDPDEFYADYSEATSLTDAKYRSEHYLMSGGIVTPDQEPEIASSQPSSGSSLIHNSEKLYEDGGDTYVVLDCFGEEAFRVYRGGAYIGLEEVAAYVYAFGELPVNYDPDKDAEPTDSPWGEYLRLNNSTFYGNTHSYPYEPELPDISGCGGNLVYYEIDIGTTGTDCDPKYRAELYNDGYEITRGAARIVYSRYYEDSRREVEDEDRYVFYTYNHYNDFQEYLNYEGGWGKMFGNITGGGVISSRDPDECNPTPYVKTVRAPIA